MTNETATGRPPDFATKPTLIAMVLSQDPLCGFDPKDTIL